MDDRNDWQLELLREFKVANVVRRYRHDCAGTVADEDVVGDPDRNGLAVDRIDGI